ncbi:uncharacterized protein ASCRUDRAFT_73108 [Ascoidea rubescens DSM 1968]|uniref:Uncharacterized protein n=1 Tax=Ascoidea rubescens DSM 1968 TaxID=1344418 RepID=A0A1D2V886_9ASCO|nr:hypothetical protein ASCRUDRAFT_73108 [Ascoidea rubescens DSM 1968]ODV57820.1 hypothetical protein ASCRUDRAFT_73108 [Ascoidea rubescens DSM 1968]
MAIMIIGELEKPLHHFQQIFILKMFPIELPPEMVVTTINGLLNNGVDVVKLLDEFKIDNVMRSNPKSFYPILLELIYHILDHPNHHSSKIFLDSNLLGHFDETLLFIKILFAQIKSSSSIEGVRLFINNYFSGSASKRNITKTPKTDIAMLGESFHTTYINPMNKGHKFITHLVQTIKLLMQHYKTQSLSNLYPYTCMVNSTIMGKS